MPSLWLFKTVLITATEMGKLYSGLRQSRLTWLWKLQASQVSLKKGSCVLSVRSEGILKYFGCLKRKKHTSTPALSVQRFLVTLSQYATFLLTTVNVHRPSKIVFFSLSSLMCRCTLAAVYTINFMLHVPVQCANRSLVKQWTIMQLVCAALINCHPVTPPVAAQKCLCCLLQLNVWQVPCRFAY